MLMKFFKGWVVLLATLDFGYVLDSDTDTGIYLQEFCR